MKIVINGEAVEVSGGGGWEVYSAEEIRVGAWIDGKPLYRKVVEATTPGGTGTWAVIAPQPAQGAMMKRVSCIVETSQHVWSPVPDASGNGPVKYAYNGNSETAAGLPPGISFYTGSGSYTNKPAIFILEYTKTTD